MLNPVTTDLISGLGHRLMGNVDVILFNPPYVVTDEEEVVQAQLGGRPANCVEGAVTEEVPLGDNKGIEKTWAGGKDGMRVTNRFLELVPVRSSHQSRNVSAC